MKPTSALLWLLIATAALTPGCNTQDPIETVERERARPARLVFDVDAFRAKLDHMLAAVVRHGDHAWFFKLQAPAASIDQLRPGFLSVLRSLEFPDRGSTDGEEPDDQTQAVASPTPPAWQLPEGWSEQPGDRMTFAVISAPTTGAPARMTVSVLPYSDPLASYLTKNVNRWLGQLKQQPVDQATVEKWSRPAPVSGDEAVWFELIGSSPRPSLPAGHPSVASSGGGRQTDESASPPDKPRDFTCQAPSDWKLVKSSSLRKATFLMGDQDKRAELSVSAFPGERGRKMGSLSLNIQRWAGEIRLPVDSGKLDELAAAATEIEVGGYAGHRIRLDGPENVADRETTLAAIVYRSPNVWFFKLRGPADTVAAQEGGFDQFLQTVEFQGE